jgi:hypothetical protein
MARAFATNAEMSEADDGVPGNAGPSVADGICVEDFDAVGSRDIGSSRFRQALCGGIAASGQWT